MKKTITSFALIITLMFSGSVLAAPHQGHRGGGTVSVGMQAGKMPHGPMGHVSGPHSGRFMPPPPPRHKYIYRGFGGGIGFSTRSYYIPSYCISDPLLYTGVYNPFCTQYMPYGAGFYINF